MYNSFFIPALDEWFEVNQDEPAREGVVPYLLQLHSLGATQIYRDGKLKRLADELSGFPFTMDEARLYTQLMSDGWTVVNEGKVDVFKLMPFLDVNGRKVAPLEKRFGNIHCIFDFAGFRWLLPVEGKPNSRREVVYSAPLPF